MKLFFHVVTLDSDMGSLGVISGDDNVELNAFTKEDASQGLQRRIGGL